MKQRWIRLFCLTERTHLEENLNLFLRDRDVVEIKVWTDANWCWCAHVIYCYPDAPTYTKAEDEANSSDLE